ncbi:MucR family transcriptional regulator [uncultured Roseibium sp.]|uniref:MucR family transcriptional regulator n=1 Tax=uncultured Roseibium sp. TaxID=1936171 RepID=UPI00262B9132|nr:MucR family transcriptional regulator [uncultured Roseibium sp.]
MEDQKFDQTFVELTADIVSAYAESNTISSQDMVELIGSVHSALKGVVEANRLPEPEPLVPAVPIKKSVTPEFIICLEDGKKYKSLKRHLRTHYGLTPEDYRAKWGLDADYPMVAPGYAEMRAKLAKDMGLGTKRRGKKKKK